MLSSLFTSRSLYINILIKNIFYSFLFWLFFRKHIEVHGRPTSAVFRSPPEVGGRSAYLLTWTVDSYAPIEEYRLLYRQIQPYHKVRIFNLSLNFLQSLTRKVLSLNWCTIVFINHGSKSFIILCKCIILFASKCEVSKRWAVIGYRLGWCYNFIQRNFSILKTNQVTIN